MPKNLVRPERAKDIRARLTIRLVNLHARNARVFRPLRAVIFLNRYLGLKTQAESLSPFGTNSDSPASQFSLQVPAAIHGKPLAPLHRMAIFCLPLIL